MYQVGLIYKLEFLKVFKINGEIRGCLSIGLSS